MQPFFPTGIQEAQLLTYMKPAGVKTGLVMNFNVTSGGVVNRTGYYTPQA